MRYGLGLVAFFAVLLSVASPAAQTVNCAIQTEHTICVSERIAELETERQHLVEALWNRGDDISGEDKWLTDLESCGTDGACRIGTYLNHNQLLTLQLENPPVSAAPPLQDTQQPAAAAETPLATTERESAAPQGAVSNSSFTDIPVIWLWLGAGLAISILWVLIAHMLKEASLNAYIARQEAERDEAERITAGHVRRLQEERAQHEASAARHAAEMDNKIPPIVALAAEGGSLPFTAWASQQDRAAIFGLGLSALGRALDEAYGGHDVVREIFRRGIQHVLSQDIEAARVYLPPTAFDSFIAEVMGGQGREIAAGQARAAQASAESNALQRRHAEESRRSRMNDLVREIESAQKDLGRAHRDGSAVSARFAERRLAAAKAQLAALSGQSLD